MSTAWLTQPGVGVGDEDTLALPSIDHTERFEPHVDELNRGGAHPVGKAELGIVGNFSPGLRWPDCTSDMISSAIRT